MNKIQSKLHKIGPYEVCKISLSCFDDNRYILDGEINTLAYFHKDLKSQESWVKLVKLTKLIESVTLIGLIGLIKNLLHMHFLDTISVKLIRSIEIIESNQVNKNWIHLFF